MRVRARLLGFVVACLCTTGCVTSLTTIKLDSDGSGMLEQSLTMNAAMADQLAGMMKGLQEEADADGGAAPAEPELFTEAEMREAAEKYGEGVTFVSSSPIKTADRVGRVATYRFTDISKLRINQKPATPGGDDMSMGDDDDAADPEEMSFRFDKQPSGTSLVTIVFPEPELEPGEDDEEDAEEDDAASEAPDPQQLAMIKQIFGDLKIAINLDVNGEIVETNSPYVEGSRVTLLEMEFAELLSNDQLLNKVAQPKSIEEAKAMLKDVKGFKVNLDREVKVEFK
jgi:hypothetical protein